MQGSQFITFLMDSLILIAQVKDAQDMALWQKVISNPINIMAIFAVLFYVMVLLPTRRERNAHQQRLAELKKNDRIVTDSGIHGTIVNVTDADVLVIRVDDNNNTRINIDRSVVARIVSEDKN